MTRTVLIVEDTDLCRDALELSLTRIPGLAVKIVGTAEEALRQLGTDSLHEGDICALVTDLHLPAMDGFELIEAVRALPGRAGFPIVVISGDSDPRTPARLAGLGASAYFTKPYSPSEVRSKLERLLDAN
jgi:two-component system, chemotaxis family, chemotaxis protein CheY